MRQIVGDTHLKRFQVVTILRDMHPSRNRRDKVLHRCHGAGGMLRVDGRLRRVAMTPKRTCRLFTRSLLPQ